MNQTALNLTAITLFTLVMTSLLGPLLHIPPTVPAIAVAVVMGLGTLDTFAWQGQGSNLLLDWVAGFSPEHRDRIIRHEAGHFLVAYLLNIPVTGYTLSAWESVRQGQPGLGGVTFDTTELETELAQGNLSPQLVDRFCTVWMAGIAAETMIYGSAEGGADDRQKLQMLWASLRRSPSESDLKTRLSILRAKTLLEQNQDAYNTLVAALKRRASPEECRQLLASRESEISENPLHPN